MKSSKVTGLVVGTRKAATTWLYENMSADPRIVVSEKVKESGFFSGRMGQDAATYEQLFQSRSKNSRVEVDASVCYAHDAADRIMDYNPNMRIVLIFREPVAFLISRYTHAIRKGELSAGSPASALENVNWLRAELDYPAILARFEPFNALGQLAVFRYEDLKKDPNGFYDKVTAALGVTGRTDFSVNTDRVNVARSSRAPIVSALLSKSAIAARGMGMHGLVNKVKSAGLHTKLEIEREDQTQFAERAQVKQALEVHMPETPALYASLQSDGMDWCPGS